MYVEVCEEYIKDLNRELGEVTEIIKKKLKMLIINHGDNKFLC